MNDYMTALYQRFFQQPDFTELAADGLYSFDHEEEQRARKAAEQEVIPYGKETG